MGFAALLARMPLKFVAQHQRVQERARRRREAQATRLLELDLTRPAAVPASAPPEWPDTVADFNAR